MKQTHDSNLAESFSPITKNLDEVKESTHKIGEIVKENNTPQLAIENTRNGFPIDNARIHPRVIYDTSLEDILSKMKKILVSSI